MVPIYLQTTDSDIVQLYNYLTGISVSVQYVNELSSEWSSRLTTPLNELICDLSLSLSLELPSERMRHFNRLRISLEKLTDEAQNFPQKHPYSLRFAKISSEISNKVILIKNLISQLLTQIYVDTTCQMSLSAPTQNLHFSNKKY